MKVELSYQNWVVTHNVIQWHFPIDYALEVWYCHLFPLFKSGCRNLARPYDLVWQGEI